MHFARNLDETLMNSTAKPSKAAGKPGSGEPQPPGKPPAKPKTGKDFGREGTNKTQAAPKPDGAPPEELGLTPTVENSPYTRG